MRALAMAPVLFTTLFLVACEDPAEEAAAAEIIEPSSQADVAPVDETEATRSLPFSSDGSTVEWTGSKVTGSHDGGFREFSGAVTLAEGEVRGVELTIQTASLYSDNEDLTGHLRSDEFFDVERLPTATFRTTAIAAGGAEGATHTVTGDLTLHGVTKAIRFPATIQVVRDEVRAQAEFAIDRQDFGVTYPGRPDDLIRDGVVIRFDIHARAAEPS